MSAKRYRTSAERDRTSAERERASAKRELAKGPTTPDQKTKRTTLRKSTRSRVRRRRCFKAPKCYNIFNKNYKWNGIKGKPPTSKFLLIKEMAISVSSFNSECMPGCTRLKVPRL